MNKRFLIPLALFAIFSVDTQAQDIVDSLDYSVITGTRAPLSRRLLPVPISVVGRSSIENCDDNELLPVLAEQVPGLFVTSRGVSGYGVSSGSAGAISLRGYGASSGRVLILVDGHPQYESIYGHPVGDEYLSATAERVEVCRGAASVLYGSNAMGGAINIITRTPSEDGNRTYVKLMGGSYGSARFSVTDTYRKNRFSTVVTANYDRTDGHRDNSAFDSWGGMFKAAYELNDNWKFGGNINLSRSFSENPGSVDVPMFDSNSRVIRGTSALYADNSYNKMCGSVALYFNMGNHLINDGHKADSPAQEYLFHGTDIMTGANIYESFNIFRGNTLTAGIDAKYIWGNAYRNPETEKYADHKKFAEAAWYLSDQYNIWKFAFNAGIRMEYSSIYGLEWVPQFGVAFNPWSASSFKLSVSKGFRAPNMRELYMYMVANDQLKPEKSWSYDFTATQMALKGRLKAELSVFYTEGSNIIAVMVNGEGKRQNQNVGNFANCGLEAAIAYRPLANLSFNVNYSFLHMKTAYVGAPEHKFYLGGKWSPGRFSWDLGAMGVFGLYLTTDENPTKSDFVNLKTKFSYQLTNYLNIFVRGENLLNKKYETMKGYPMPGITVFGGISVAI